MELTGYYEKGKFNGTVLKFVAIVSMTIDHIAVVFLRNNPNCQDLFFYMRMVGRIAFPIFSFLLVQGFLHTRHLKDYVLRMLLFALVSEPLFDLTIYGRFTFESQNVFFTLLIGLLTMSAMKKWENDAVKQVSAILAGCMLAYMMRTDYSHLGVLLIVLIYNYRYFKGWRVISVILVNALINDVFSARSPGAMSGAIIFSAFASCSLIFIEMYNGEKGSKLKYAFYVFYPAHLLILYLIRLILGLIR